MPYAWLLCKTLLSHHQALLSMSNPMQSYIGEFRKQCKSIEFPCETCESSYMLENNFSEVRFGGEILDSGVSMNKVYSKYFICSNKMLQLN